MCWNANYKGTWRFLWSLSIVWHKTQTDVIAWRKCFYVQTRWNLEKLDTLGRGGYRCYQPQTLCWRLSERVPSSSISARPGEYFHRGIRCTYSTKLTELNLIQEAWHCYGMSQREVGWGSLQFVQCNATEPKVEKWNCGKLFSKWVSLREMATLMLQYKLKLSCLPSSGTPRASKL